MLSTSYRRGLATLARPRVSVGAAAAQPPSSPAPSSAPLLPPEKGAACASPVLKIALAAAAGFLLRELLDR